MSIRRNTLFNLMGSAIPLVVSLVTIPIYLGLIGESRYGVLAIAWLLLGYFGLFDLGLGRATAQRIAALRDESAVERAETFWTALALNVGLGVVGGLLIWPVATYFFGNVFIIEDSLRSEIISAIPWLIFAVPMATFSGVLSGALQGREKFLELNLISLFGTLLFQLLPLGAALYWRADLSIILPAVLLARLCTLAILFECCRRYLFAGQAATFSKWQAGKLLRFGAWVTVTSFIGPMMVILDRFVIGAIVGAKAVAYYTVPLQLAERTSIIPNSLASALFPRFSALSIDDEKMMAVVALRALVAIMTPLTIIGILLIGPFLSWWVGAEFANQSTGVGQLMLFAFWVNGFARVPLAQLQARGNPDLVAKCHILELLPYFALLYLGLKYMGLTGAAIAFLLRVSLDFILLAGLAGVLIQFLYLIFVPLLLIVMSFLVSSLGGSADMVWTVCVFGLVLLSIVWAWKSAPVQAKIVVRSTIESLFPKNDKGKDAV